MTAIVKDRCYWIDRAMLSLLLLCLIMIMLTVAVGGLLYHFRICNIFNPQNGYDAYVFTITFTPPILAFFYYIIKAIICGIEGGTPRNHFKYKSTNTNDTDMDIQNIALFPEAGQTEFDFNVLMMSNSYSTISGLKVKVDKIYRDVTQTTVLAISGTMVINGVKVRGVWDPNGNIVEFKKINQLLAPKSLFANLNEIFSNTPANIFKLVHVQNVLPITEG